MVPKGCYKGCYKARKNDTKPSYQTVIKQFLEGGKEIIKRLLKHYEKVSKRLVKVRKIETGYSTKKLLTGYYNVTRRILQGYLKVRQDHGDHRTARPRVHELLCLWKVTLF